MELYKTLDEIERAPALIGYVRMLRRAWEVFDLDLVLCVNGAPTLFRTTRAAVVAPDELRELHRRFWNQGVASVLLVKDPKTVALLSGLEPPQPVTDSLASETPLAALVASFQELSEADQDSLFQSIGNGEFYRRYSKNFQSNGLVDQDLSRNLRELSRLLSKSASHPPLAEETAHNFICRLLFTCYLVDRGIYRLPGFPEDAPLPLHQALSAQESGAATAYLYGVFRELKRKFNGSMFDQDLGAEESLVAPHMERIVSFLRGDDIRAGQRTLGFWAYDFRLIPIETISGIYEDFLTEEDRKGKGAHYTPRLLAETTLDVACETGGDWDALRYIDPCCGSGVFVVTLFNRLATSWELKNPQGDGDDHYYETKANALLAILRNQIRGMDIKPSACTLACFSLYVALLDSFDPAAIETYIERTRHKLPKLLKTTGSSAPDIPVIHHGDSLTATRFRDEPFDRVIGNPPWGGTSRGSGDPSLRFIRKADEFLKPGGRACLLLPSKNFLNITSDAQQAEWLESHTLERVVQLADFRFILFPTAKCPCMIVRFALAVPAGNHEIIYDTPKFDLSARRKGFVRITSSDRKVIPAAKMRQAAKEKRAHVLWKRLFWGTPRDQRLIRYLDGFQKLKDRAGTPASKKPWRKGEGIQPDVYNKCLDPKTAWWKADQLFVEGNSPHLKHSYFLFPQDVGCIGDRFPRLRRATENRDIFQPPHVLISQGFGKVVFCDFPVLFQHSLHAIHGPPEDESLLLFLTAYLQSSMAKYYCFHTSSKLGIERDVVRFDELLRLPFPLPSEAPSEQAQAIVDEIAGAMKAEKAALENLAPGYSTKEKSQEWLSLRKKRADALRARFEPLIFRYFRLLEPEQALVLDTVHIFEPSATPTTPDRTDLPTLTPVARASSVSGYSDGLRTYSDTLTGWLNAWAKERKSDWRVNASGWIGEASGLAMVRLHIVPEREQRPFSVDPAGKDAWAWAYEQFKEKQAAIHLERQMLGFLGSEFFVLRPHSLVHWTRTQALNDADEFFSQYLLRQKEAAR